MVEIDESKLDLIRNYMKLLEIVEEGFQYVEDQYLNGGISTGDHVLSDIFLAFSQFDAAHQTMANVFERDGGIVEGIHDFNELIEIIGELENTFKHFDTRTRIVIERLFPAFSAWKELIESNFKLYLQH